MSDKPAEGTHDNWVMTLFASENYKTMEERKKQVEDYPDWVKFVNYGFEHTKEGKEHLQCYVGCWHSVRFSQFQSWIGDSYRAPMIAGFRKNEAYCSKESSLIKLGTQPMQGRRTDILGAKRRLDQLYRGEDVMDLATEEPHFNTVIRYERSFRSYVSRLRLKKYARDFTKPEIIYVWGLPGVGKDKYVDERYPTLYDVPADDGYKWKDGYNMDRVVVYRNISPSAIKNPNQFLKELDRRVCQVAIKGGFVPWKPEVILLTSIFSPEIFGSKTFDDPKEFTRRVTKTVPLETCHYTYQEYLNEYDTP